MDHGYVLKQAVNLFLYVLRRKLSLFERTHSHSSTLHNCGFLHKFGGRERETFRIDCLVSGRFNEVPLSLTADL